MKHKLLICGVLSCTLVVSGCGGDKNKETENYSAVTEIGTNAPEGFYYDTNGDLRATGDLSMTAEDTLQAYFKALALLDFNTALKYSDNGSSVIEGYTDEDANFGGESNIAYDFTHKMYKQVLLNMTINKVVDIVTMSDEVYITLSVHHYNLNDNNFWKDDRNMLFKQMKAYATSEDSETADTKTLEFLSEYIKDYYSKSDIPTSDTEIEIRMKRSTTGAWVVYNDQDLADLINYNNGSYAISYIRTEYSNWYSAFIDEVEKARQIIENEKSKHESEMSTATEEEKQNDTYKPRTVKDIIGDTYDGVECW